MERANFKQYLSHGLVHVIDDYAAVDRNPCVSSPPEIFISKEKQSTDVQLSLKCPDVLTRGGYSKKRLPSAPQQGLIRHVLVNVRSFLLLSSFFVT